MTNERLDFYQEVYNKKIAENKARVKHILENEELIDEDGYPTSAALEAIQKWHWDDPKGWFEFIHSLWHLRDWGWTEVYGGEDEFSGLKIEDDVLRYHISTAGWSGNESIIRVMQENRLMWSLQWVQSRRGGHYIFELKEIKE